jgi:hypothetical protein
MTVARTATCETPHEEFQAELPDWHTAGLGRWRVILLYTFPQQTMALPVVITLAGIGHMYLNHRRKRRAY